MVDNQQNFNEILKQKNIILPQVPRPAGNYQPFVRSGNLVFINQVALKDGKFSIRENSGLKLMSSR